MLGPLVHELEPAIQDRVENTVYGDLARPQLLPKPTCKVWLICGPPASGKSTFVKTNAGKDDIVIDLDAIAREYGMSRDRPSEAITMLLLDRNERLAALASEPPERIAWVIMGGAGAELRQWWCNALAVEPDHLIVLTPPQEELYRRIMYDMDRRDVQHLHKRLVDKWFAQDNG